MASKIPVELHESVLQKAAASVTFRDIASWLAAEHKVVVSHMAICRLVGKEGKQRSVAAKHVAQTKVARAVVTDIDRIGRLIGMGMKAVKRLDGTKDVLGFARVVGETRKLIEYRMKVAGATTDDQANDGVGRSVIVIPAESDD